MQIYKYQINIEVLSYFLTIKPNLNPFMVGCLSVCVLVFSDNKEEAGVQPTSFCKTIIIAWVVEAII